MLNNAIILEVKDNGTKATAAALIKDACINCTQGCAKRGSPFTVTNPKGLNIKTGQTVSLKTASWKTQLQSVLALLLPVLGAITGYLVMPKKESLQVLGVLAGFVVVALLYFGATRFIKPKLNEIESVIG